VIAISSARNHRSIDDIARPAASAQCAHGQRFNAIKRGNGDILVGEQEMQPVLAWVRAPHLAQDTRWDRDPQPVSGRTIQQS